MCALVCFHSVFPFASYKLVYSWFLSVHTKTRDILYVLEASGTVWYSLYSLPVYKNDVQEVYRERRSTLFV